MTWCNVINRGEVRHSDLNDISISTFAWHKFWSVTYAKILVQLHVDLLTFYFSSVRFTTFLLAFGGGTTQAWSSECKFGQADFTDCMSFLPSNLMEETNPNLEALKADK